MVSISLHMQSSVGDVWLPTWLCGCFKGIGQLIDLYHDLLPGLVNLNKHLGLSGQLPLDVWGHKDAL